jgi:hypothetical protein
VADTSSDPEAVVQRQLEAYNAHDLDAFMGTYAEAAELLVHPSTLLAKGAAQIRDRYAARFRDHRPHAAILKRIVIGSTVIDEEEITTAPAGVPQKVRAVAIYEVHAGRIARAWFIS